jgi:DNA-directed RNA polymerase subunit omega
MNAELVHKALEKVTDPYVLINMVSRRMRQLTDSPGATGRPLIADAGTLGPADIALHEIIEGKMGFELPEFVKLTRPTGRDRNRPKGWLKPVEYTSKMAA